MNKTTKQISKIPNFTDKEEEAKFWETHSVSDFLDEFKLVKARFAKNLSEGITIRFDESTLNKIREIAHEKGIGPTTLARMWIMDHLKQQTVR
jgi:predicted DNA binding CopG/RHH family protein